MFVPTDRQPSAHKLHNVQIGRIISMVFCYIRMQSTDVRILFVWNMMPNGIDDAFASLFVQCSWNNTIDE